MQTKTRDKIVRMLRSNFSALEIKRKCRNRVSFSQIGGIKTNLIKGTYKDNIDCEEMAEVSSLEASVLTLLIEDGWTNKKIMEKLRYYYSHKQIDKVRNKK